VINIGLWARRHRFGELGMANLEFGIWDLGLGIWEKEFDDPYFVIRDFTYLVLN